MKPAPWKPSRRRCWGSWSLSVSLPCSLSLPSPENGTVGVEISRVYAQATRRIPTGALNDVLGDAQIAVQLPMEGGRRLKIITPPSRTRPSPTFLFFVNDAKLMHFAYERYLEKQTAPGL